ncbi:DUF4157 domain-containing protein [Paenibacillus sp. R14(2021)]|uniref:eCIS core domain-containing protein n=1 Tax=Paenibacillus sp. R14(2021) TaxID=2859228 RepID=UPI001C615BC1|nr:DUF4157 domain-containing protein [Paenibacillus sp. R14(2021)]
MKTFGSGKSIRKMDKSSYKGQAALRSKSNPYAPLQRALASGAPLQAAEMHALQRSVGNQAAGQFIGAGGRQPIMAKMTINQPTDAYELEADQVSFRVANDLQASSGKSDEPVQRMEQGESEEEELQLKSDSAGVLQRMEQGESEEEELQLKPDSAGVLQRMEQGESEEEELQLKPDSAGVLQRMEQGESEEEELQLKPDSAGVLQRMEQGESEEEELQLKRDPFAVIQREAEGAPEDAGPKVEAAIDESRGKGQPLPDALRKKLEASFKADFSKVSIHTDNAADQLAKQVGARAFTTGSDIYFRQGEFKPDTASGIQLLSHELTHVVQQS